jgi:cobyrinic acid a,c-diamide synthase
MYLTEAIVDTAGRAWPMVGVFPTRARMQERLAKLGYVEVETASGTARGHEFRYSEIDSMPGDPKWAHRYRGTHGSYVHLHFLSCPRLAQDFVDACEKWHSKS